MFRSRWNFLPHTTRFAPSMDTIPCFGIIRLFKLPLKGWDSPSFYRHHLWCSLPCSTESTHTCLRLVLCQDRCEEIGPEFRFRRSCHPDRLFITHLCSMGIVQDAQTLFLVSMLMDVPTFVKAGPTWSRACQIFTARTIVDLRHGVVHLGCTVSAEQVFLHSSEDHDSSHAHNCRWRDVEIP